MAGKKRSKSKEILTDDGFLMSPKIDFVFKLIFGDEKNKDLLIAFLSAVLGVPKEEFEGIEIINSELLREFAEDKKGILDVRVKTSQGKQIDIEIQILPTEFMPERTLLGQGFSRSVDPLPKGSDPTKIRQIIHNYKKSLEASTIRQSREILRCYIMQLRYIH